jgi:4-amino-4-deoxy-L-arabinose transferase-like glycosyltransferase
MTSVTVDDTGPAAATTARPGEGRAPLPRGAWLIAGAVGLVLVACADRYGWHRDELYFREAGRHLAWGYVDQPPFTPLVARLADLVAPGNLVVLRLAPALATVATIVLAALVVGELGGDRRAQLVGAGTAASAGIVLGAGHLLSTATFDLTAWMAVLWLVARLLRTADPRWWVAIGAVAGVAMLNKNLVVLLLATVLVALAIERRRDLLVTRWLPVGGALALAIAAPHLVWQATHGWPQFTMAQALSDRIGGEDRTMLLPQQVLFLGPLLVPLWWWGVRRLGWDPAGRRFRPLLWAWPLALAAVFVTGGRPYYPTALTLVLALAGAPAAARRGRWIVAVLAVNAAASAVFTLPVLPVSTVRLTGSVNDTIAETIGWPELTAEVATVVHGLPAAERRHVVILGFTYGEAGAVDRFGPALGLPPAYSGHNSYYDFRRPTDDGATVVAIRYRVRDLTPEFAHCARVASVDNHHGVDNEAQGVPILVCRGLRTSWADTWPRLRHVA